MSARTTGRRPMGISRGVPPSRQLESLINEVTDLHQALVNLDFLRGKLHVQAPLRIGDLEINVVNNPNDQNAIDVTFNNVRTDTPPIVIVTLR